MNDKTIAFIIGIVSSSAAYGFWKNILTAIIVAFVGGLVTWGTRELCEYAKRRYQRKKKHQKETR